jgi:hypothetical protein
MFISTCVLKHLICWVTAKKIASIITAQNVLHEIQHTPRRVSSRTGHQYKQASTMRWWNSSSFSMGTACTRCLGVPTGKNPEDSSQASVEATHWDSWPDIYYCLTVTVLFLWGALSDERTDLSFVYVTGHCQRSLSRVQVPWDSQPYFTVIDICTWNSLFPILCVYPSNSFC